MSVEKSVLSPRVVVPSERGASPPPEGSFGL
jgi:hypothetical protein